MWCWKQLMAICTHLVPNTTPLHKQRIPPVASCRHGHCLRRFTCVFTQRSGRRPRAVQRLLRHAIVALARCLFTSYLLSVQGGFVRCTCAVVAVGMFRAETPPRLLQRAATATARASSIRSRVAARRLYVGVLPNRSSVCFAMPRSCMRPEDRSLGGKGSRSSNRFRCITTFGQLLSPSASRCRAAACVPTTGPCRRSRASCQATIGLIQTQHGSPSSDELKMPRSRRDIQDVKTPSRFEMSKKTFGMSTFFEWSLAGGGSIREQAAQPPPRGVSSWDCNA